MILALRTDRPQSELYLYENGELVGQEKWQAHRELSVTIHKKIQTLLIDHGVLVQGLEAVIFFQGPGSFTGLRIGISVANALGSSLNIPVAATRGDDWQKQGLTQLAGKKSFQPIEPFYGAEAHITKPVK